MTRVLLALLLLVPSPVSASDLEGKASWVRPSLGSEYLAMRIAKGTRVRICGALGCVRRTVNDYGPSKRIHPDRVADLSRSDFARICGHPETLGTCSVEVDLVSVDPTLPPTDTTPLPEPKGRRV